MCTNEHVFILNFIVACTNHHLTRCSFFVVANLSLPLRSNMLIPPMCPPMQCTSMLGLCLCSLQVAQLHKNDKLQLLAATFFFRSLFCRVHADEDQIRKAVLALGSLACNAERDACRMNYALSVVGDGPDYPVFFAQHSAVAIDPAKQVAGAGLNPRFDQTKRKR